MRWTVICRRVNKKMKTETGVKKEEKSQTIGQGNSRSWQRRNFEDTKIVTIYGKNIFFFFFVYLVNSKVAEIE